MANADSPGGTTDPDSDGQWPDSDLTVTRTIPEEYWQNRQGDLAGTQTRGRGCQSCEGKRIQDAPNVLTDPPAFQDIEMEPSLDNTQQLTQPYYDPRRAGGTNSDVSDNDASDVICILHPNSREAHDAVVATRLSAPQHILQNGDLQSNTEDDLLRPEFMPTIQSRDIALRISSRLKNPEAGFVFGRNKSRCDVLLVEDENAKAVSNMHFRIFLNHQGTLMLQDTSTNGTIVDDDHLRYKNKQGVQNQKSATRMINNGTLISVVGPKKVEIKFLVRTPKRGDHEAIFHEKLTKYVSAHSKSQVSIAPTSRSHTFGMHWHGGSLYNVVSLLGKGAFATVYRLATKDEGLPLAAKELDKRRFMKNGILDLKFDNEIKIMKGLRHPNIVQYIDYHDHDQWVYIIMEFVPHGELSAFLRDQGPLSEGHVQTITRQILHALDYLHRRNVTHRDIKPDNILIASLDPLVVKLSDFGLSKCVNDEETFLKTFCGTLLYCAPEVYPEYASYHLGEPRKRRRLGEPARKSSPYDQSVDMWSFGAVLFHILCGKAPIMGRGDDRGAQMLNNIMTKDVDFEPLRERGISEQAIDFISKLLNRNPLQRPNEHECFQHPWICDLADEVDYMDEDEIPIVFQQGLEAVEEAEEDFLDDEEEGAFRAMFGLPEKLDVGATATNVARLDPRYGVKRRRLSSDAPARDTNGGGTESSVLYPQLPEIEHDAPNPSPVARGDRLFGEITPSVLRSSGVFGQVAPAPADIPAIGNAVEQVSVNDFVTFEVNETHEGGEVPTEHQIRYPQALPLPALPSSAASLFGAEAQIGMLNMASPEAAASEDTSPDTTNPMTPKTREATPSDTNINGNVGELEQSEAVRLSPPEIECTRHISLELIEDDEAYAAFVRARDASRIRKRERKANQERKANEQRMADEQRKAEERKASTFHWNTGPTHSSTAHMARTMDGRVESEPCRAGGSASAVISSENAKPSNRLDRSEPTTLYHSLFPSATASEDGFVKPLQRLGKLISLPGSFTSTTIYLHHRTTSWGRDSRCTVEHMDKQETRIPKAALQITFWAPEIEARIERGDDWMKVPGICTLVSTSTSRCIWVNDVELHAQSRDGDAALYGKIYTGDVITIFKSQDPALGYLKFKVEIGYGDSARVRPENEIGFQVRRETQHHRRFIDSRKSMNESGKENVGETVIGAGVLVGTVGGK